MTNEEILAMEGNRLKAEVAQKIMGIKVEYPFAEGYPYYLREAKDGKMKWDIVPDYPGDISAAWQVVDKVYIETGMFLLRWSPILLAWMCSFYSEGDECRGETAPEAICKAALLERSEAER